MRLKNLETFYWVATLGSFRQTAERLNTTQPAISARIAALEDDLGVRLFDRHGRTPTLTAKGAELLAYAEKFLELRNEIESAVADRRTVRGVVRIGLSETLVHTWFPDLLARVHAVYPNLTVEMHVDTTTNLRDELVRRDLDIAFLVGPVAEPTMSNRPLCRYGMTWVAAPSLEVPRRRLSPAELAAYPIITFPRRTRPYVNIRDALRGLDVGAVRIHCSSSLTTIIHLAKLGHGIGAVPDVVVARDLRAGRLIVVDSELSLQDLEFTATYPAAPDNALAKAIAEIAADVARRGAAPATGLP